MKSKIVKRTHFSSIQREHENAVRLIFVFSALYAILLIYASLMPFDIATADDIETSISRFWDAWPLNPHARVSGSDVMSNLLLYIPLGWLIAVRGRLGGIRSVAAMIIATTVCALLSFAIEMVQMILASRIASGADWVFNTISGCLGATGGVLFGERIWLGGIRWLQKRWRTSPADIGTLMFLVLLAADAWAPYMPTILLKQVWRSLEGSHFDMLEGFALHPWHWWAVTRIAPYSVLTILLAIWGRRAKAPSLWGAIGAAVAAAGFSLIFELGKIFIASRSFNTANVVTGWFGCFLGILMVVFFLNRMDTHRKLESIMAILFLYLIYLWWMPFNFTWDPGMVRRALPSPVQFLPLYHYAMGAELNHIRLFVQSVFLLGLLTYLLRVRLGWVKLGRGGVFASAFLAAIFGLMLEGGQLLLPSRTASMTDVYCFALGAGIGAWMPMAEIGMDKVDRERWPTLGFSARHTDGCNHG